PLTNRGSYAVKHNPFVFFDDVTGSNNPAAAYCIAHVRPYSELATDLSNNTVARYNFITPNVCNDMHNSCAPLHDKVKQGDVWLSTEVPRILASRPYAAKGVLFITWDEAKTGDGPIGMIVLSPVAKGGGYSNRIQYTTSATLRAAAEILESTHTAVGRCRLRGTVVTRTLCPLPTRPLWRSVSPRSSSSPRQV